jgi:TatD DNase family protein
MSEIKYIDTHAHVNLSAFDEDREEVLLRTRTEGVAHINVGTKASTSAAAVKIAEAHKDVYAIVGLHPIQTTAHQHDEDEIGEGGKPFVSKGEVFDPEVYRELCNSKSVIGIGECGFDYYHNAPETYAVQEAAFIAQIELANELQLPVMIHTRGPKPGEESPTGRSVYADVLAVLKQYANVPFNVHFYAGTVAEAKQFFEMGGTISFTGVITFAKVYEEVVRATPLQMIHAETDCPYVAPVPYRGKRNEPSFVKEVYKTIAQIKGLHEEEVRLQLLKNAENLYGIRL